MPAIEYANLYQIAVVWPKTGDSDYSDPTLGDRLEVACRWVEGKREALDAQGNVIALDAWAEVAVEIAMGSLMWLGRARDLIGTAGPEIGEGPLMQVVSVSKTPDPRAREYYREVGLVRFRDTLPRN